MTKTSGAVGRSMLQALTDSEIVTLKYISFSDNPSWFRGEGAEEATGVDLLTLALSRQTALRSLNLKMCELFDRQKEPIMQAVPSTTECNFSESIF